MMWGMNVEAPGAFLWGCVLGFAADLPFGSLLVPLLWDLPSAPGRVRAGLSRASAPKPAQAVPPVARLVPAAA